MPEKVRSPYERFLELGDQAGVPPVLEAATYSARTRQGDREEKRRFAFVFSTGGWKRDGFEIVQSGWQLDDFNLNPRVLWCHRGSELPIGNADDVRVARTQALGRHLRGDITFLGAEKNPLAEQVFLMYRDGDLDAVSVRWDPLEWEEVSREEIENEGAKLPPWIRAGIRFKRARLLEVSAVPLPADPQALMIRARNLPTEIREQLTMPRPEPLGDRPVLRLDGHPIEVSRPAVFDLGRTAGTGEAVTESERVAVEPEQGVDALAAGERSGKDEPPTDVSASPDLTREEKAEEPAIQLRQLSTERGVVSYSSHGDVPLADRDRPWDAQAARGRLAKWASSDGSGDKDKIDWGEYAKGALYVVPTEKTNFGGYKGFHHDIVNGRFVVVWRGVVAAAQRLQQGAFDVPESALGGMRQHIAREYRRFGEKAPWERAAGRLYADLHQQLRNPGPDDNIARMQRWAEELALELFGPERLSEPWEVRFRPFGSEHLWRELAAAVMAHRKECENEDDDPVLETLRHIGDAIRPQWYMAEEYRECLRKLAALLGEEVNVEAEEGRARLLERVAALKERQATEPSAAIGLDLLKKELGELREVARRRPSRSVLDEVRRGMERIQKATD